MYQKLRNVGISARCGFVDQSIPFDLLPGGEQTRSKRCEWIVVRFASVVHVLLMWEWL